MGVLRHLTAGTVAVALGAFAAQYALTAEPDPAPERRTTTGQAGRPAPAQEQPVEAPVEAPAADLPSCDGAPDCTEVAGRVVYVEPVDPDGDGDLHVVVFDRRSISAPGMTSIDVRPGLRPATDPQVGDRVAAAGPVQTGSFGQDQVHALAFTVLG